MTGWNKLSSVCAAVGTPRLERPLLGDEGKRAAVAARGTGR
jgi:hypothetical protein